MNNAERDAAIDDLIRRVEALEANCQSASYEEEQHVRNEDSESGEQG